MNLPSYPRINGPACYPHLRINGPAFWIIYALTVPLLRINGPAYTPLAQWWRGFPAPSCIPLYLKNLYYGEEPVFMRLNKVNN